jgi:hypothetical protein
MGVKRLEVLGEIIPDLARVAELWTNRADATEQLWQRYVQMVGR